MRKARSGKIRKKRPICLSTVCSCSRLKTWSISPKNLAKRLRTKRKSVKRAKRRKKRFRCGRRRVYGGTGRKKVYRTRQRARDFVGGSGGRNGKNGVWKNRERKNAGLFAIDENVQVRRAIEVRQSEISKRGAWRDTARLRKNACGGRNERMGNDGRSVGVWQRGQPVPRMERDSDCVFRNIIAVAKWKQKGWVKK